MTIRIAFVEIGKMALDKHMPATTANEDFARAATISPNHPGIDSMPHFETLDAAVPA